MAPSNGTTLEKAEYWIGAAFGLESAQEQMIGAFVLAVGLIVSSALSFGWTLALLPVPIILFVWAIVRIAYGRMG